ncbi:Thioesterase superfamily, putative [Angomonas deanei]|uniref:Thioesterase superfamily, putative n=1 Tax=Angomonas deanei TaxID=59799 RepID=A0A7G2CGT3_9TRYP|nr:Thioesterase superfamily, putative [Angomonas deanei]
MFGPSPTHTMATVSFNSFMFSRPVMAGDNVRISSQVIHVGNTSVAVHCEMEKQSWQSKKYQYLGESFVTFVVLDAKDITKPKTGILPAVQLNSEKTQQKCALYNTMKQQSKTVGQHINSVPLSQLTPEMVESPQNQSKPVKVPMKHTTTLVEKKFERSAININGVVFGGETLSFLEKSALHCGRLFTGSGSVFTLGMLDMTFEGPIHCEDLARCTATVVCVRRSTLLVSVRIDVDRHGKRRPTNRASFLLVSLDESGAPTEIQKGIELNGTTPEELRTYWGGRLRMEEAAKVRIRPVD